MMTANMKNHTATQVILALKKKGSPQKAKSSAWFFKTGAGQYGHGDIFVGVSVPEQRAIAKQFAGLSFAEIDKLLRNKIHECRLTALHILLLQKKQADVSGRQMIAKFYLAHTACINNWDLVDTSARELLGEYLLDKKRDVLYRFACSHDLWERRIAIIATYAFIKEHDFNDTFAIAELLMNDKEDLMHKAVGWMIREVGNRSRAKEEAFLKKYAAVMPRTMLRYAIEKFPEPKRRYYMTMRSKRR